MQPVHLITPPFLKPLIKSKCFTSGLGRTCPKPNHSCVRRVVSFAGIPCKPSWRRIATVLSEILKRLLLTFDVFDISLSSKVFRERVQNLRPPTGVTPGGVDCGNPNPIEELCAKCKKPMNGTYGVAVGDIDQAYEMCSKKDAYTGWLTLRELCVDTDFLIDKRNRKISIHGIP